MKVILGGTFDPIHHAHLRTAIELREALGIDAVTLVPCHLPPHRDEPGASPTQRLQMLYSAIGSEAALDVDERELARNTPSYTVDTLEELRREHGAREPLAMVVGTDSFASIDRWDRWQRLLELAHIIVVERPGFVVPADSAAGRLLADNADTDAASLKQAPSGRVWSVSLPLLDISATGVRRAVREGRSIRYLVPDPVRDVIVGSGLYRN
ncbi:nicotinate-nucleotide adenylyltransferase [Marinobacter halodurans]|uniref:Probable nicotinate-nucleotide adenylyltransferase n=1 Tax=Marinobacter halodurans TaxID=2528979 RepID=A0ABY1ZKT6_9GAMM|nr:nicotinate-nucleotide adenylyltransferase [Marinobacter halodurans]TBW56216.1 nicotinate-nucleotide adenylyltransferase [Marinobacter halodurans]